MNDIRLFFKDNKLVLIQRDGEITGKHRDLTAYDYCLYFNKNNGFSTWIDSKFNNLTEDSIPEQLVKLAKLELLLEGIS